MLNYSKYKKLSGKYNVTSEIIYNVDESGMSTVPIKAIALKGIKEVGNIPLDQKVNVNVTVNVFGIRFYLHALSKGSPQEPYDQSCSLR